ncbi:MAG TPA: hypothetical protein VGD78_22900 [Chthoniobacterales bacterium]
MSGLAEIQKAIEQLSPPERAELRRWLGTEGAAREAEWATLAQTRLEGIDRGERPTHEATEVLAEARRLLAG